MHVILWPFLEWILQVLKIRGKVCLILYHILLLLSFMVAQNVFSARFYKTQENLRPLNLTTPSYYPCRGQDRKASLSQYHRLYWTHSRCFQPLDKPSRSSQLHDLAPTYHPTTHQTRRKDTAIGKEM